MIKSNIFRKESAALSKAEELGCEGTHKHDGGFMPCKSHKEWEELTSKPEGEIDELVDFDGTMNSSKIPIIDPHVSPRKTTDQTVAATRTAQDPYALGFRRYVGEEDMSGLKSDILFQIAAGGLNLARARKPGESTDPFSMFAESFTQPLLNVGALSR